MSRPVRILARLVFTIGLFILVLAASLPFVPADDFGKPVGRALAAALERRLRNSLPSGRSFRPSKTC